MSDTSVYSFCCTHIGSRSNYEDNFLINSNYLASDLQNQMPDKRMVSYIESDQSKVKLFAVSDGMGGHNAGEVASRICVEQLALAKKDLQNCASLREVLDRLQEIILNINKIVLIFGNKQNEFKGMGATLVIFVAYGKEYAVLNIGDSRAYLFNNKLTQITRDNTEGQRMLDLGILTRKELSKFPASKNLSRYIGYSADGYVLRADEYGFAADGGIVVLCSDGVSDFVSEMRMTEILSSKQSVDIIGKQIIREAVDNQNADNATIMLIPLWG